MLKKKLLMMLLPSAVIGAVAIKAFPSLHEYSTDVSKSESAYKEDLTEETNNEELMSSASESENTTSNTSTPVSSGITTKKEISNSDINIENKTSVTSDTENTSSTINSNNNQIDIILPEENIIEPIDWIPNVPASSASKIVAPSINYDRTTSIYADDDETLIRVEYYLNNKLVYYSYVEEFNAETNSYIERICKWDYEKDTEILVLTNIYSNGIIVSSC